ncbi:pyruvate, phosphate dikinase [soil metagenome]
MARKWTYSFEEGSASQRELLGGKGANLAEMTSIGLTVPPGFIITTEASKAFLDANELPEAVWDEILERVRQLESRLNQEFGSPAAPLLVSVRSGAAVSMPGMMDTILNLGLNDDTVQGLAKLADERFAWDCYRRLIQMYSNVVLSIDGDRFEDALDAEKRKTGIFDDQELPAAALRELVETFKNIVQDQTGSPFPQDPLEQLRLATIAVFASWNNRRAISYRKQHGIPDDLGTAVNVQAMVFGNMGETSATGVAFTRNPSTGESGLFGEFLTNAQGEDVVAGVRTPLPIADMSTVPGLEDAAGQLQQVADHLERHYRDMQDIEFTIQHGELFVLQTRTGKRTGQSAVKIACDLVDSGLIEPSDAVRRIEPDQLDQLLHPMIDPDFEPEVLTTGLPASPGAAAGEIVFDADEAKRRGDAGDAVILVRRETSPDDFHGMVAAQGVLTARGGMTSHAAVVARGMGKPCVAGAGDLEVDHRNRTISVNGRTLKAGDVITIDGATGRVIAGRAPMVEPKVGGDIDRILSWADEIRRLGVRANADTGADARTAREFGAEGIGLCRTEHMFFGEDRLEAVRKMILSQNATERKKALEPLLDMQRDDFAEIFQAMDGLPVTIRTLDPPLHEFLPHSDEELFELAESIGVDVDVARNRVATLVETNPMLGHRGCRLGISFPEITEMQARAIFEAAIQCKNNGVVIHPEIMIPLVSDVAELELQRGLVDNVAKTVFRETGATIDYEVGTMIELPRAALVADKIATAASFFSFGTNDLTQTAYGLSRDDSGRFLPMYVERGIFPADPFVTIDRDGVGELIEIAAERGRSVRSDLKLGICGEHGGDPESVAFCHETNLDYVSCSPFRVPVARLAAAQAVLNSR